MVFTDKINIVMHHSSQGMYKKDILSKSLNIEVCKSTIGVLLILFFLVVSSRFVGYFEQAAEGLIDPNIIVKVVLLRFPDFITLLIPLSFFLGVVITISRMYADREIYGYFSGNLSKNDLIKYLLPQSIIYFLITLSLSIYIAPYTKELSKNLLSVDSIEEQFKSIKSKEIMIFDKFNGFIFANDKGSNDLNQVVFLSSSNEQFSIVLAKKLSSKDKDTSLDLTLNNGLIYQNIFSEDSSFTSEFGEFSFPLDKDIEQIDAKTLSKVFDYSEKSSKSQKQWNISIPITIFILLIIGVHISKVEPRQGRLAVLLPAIFVYFLYLSLLILARESFEDNAYQTHYYSWYVHLAFFIFGIYAMFKSNLNKAILVDVTGLTKSSNLLKAISLLFIFLIFLWILQ
ncbi:LptF/LptG family permease [Gammaproteobacteria bacterium]|nr:LptF/LptG family permease [Gammaproteobacteria bacterium]